MPAHSMALELGRQWNLAGWPCHFQLGRAVRVRAFSALVCPLNGKAVRALGNGKPQDGWLESLQTQVKNAARQPVT